MSGPQLAHLLLRSTLATFHLVSAARQVRERLAGTTPQPEWFVAWVPPVEPLLNLAIGVTFGRGLSARSLSNSLLKNRLLAPLVRDAGPSRPAPPRKSPGFPRRLVPRGTDVATEIHQERFFNRLLTAGAGWILLGLYAWRGSLDGLLFNLLLLLVYAALLFRLDDATKTVGNG